MVGEALRVYVIYFEYNALPSINLNLASDLRLHRIHWLELYFFVCCSSSEEFVLCRSRLLPAPYLLLSLLFITLFAFRKKLVSFLSQLLSNQSEMTN